MMEDKSDMSFDMPIPNSGIIPRCPYFNECGGCVTQHIPYEVQLNNKKNFVVSKLKKFGIIVPETVESFSYKEYGYRNRMDPIFSQFGLGFRKKGKFDQIVHIDSCSISNDKLNTLISEINAWFNKYEKELDFFDMKKKSGTLKFALIRAPENSDDSTVSFLLNSDSTRMSEVSDLIEKTTGEFSAKNILVAKSSKESDGATSADIYALKGSEYVREELRGNFLEDKFSFRYEFHSQGFFQNNTKVAEMMVKKTRDIFSSYGTENTKDALLIDLYGGVGTFGIANAEFFSECVIAESYAESINCAKKNIDLNSLENCSAICIDATYAKNSGDISSRVNKYKRRFIITDPPRSGMHQKTIQFIKDLSPEVVIYISCNPEQMAKELRSFKEFEVKSLSIFDLFPQTNHIEAMVELVRKKNSDS